MINSFEVKDDRKLEEYSIKVFDKYYKKSSRLGLTERGLKVMLTANVRYADMKDRA